MISLALGSFAAGFLLCWSLRSFKGTALEAAAFRAGYTEGQCDGYAEAMVEQARRSRDL